MTIINNYLLFVNSTNISMKIETVMLSYQVKLLNVEMNFYRVIQIQMTSQNDVFTNREDNCFFLSWRDKVKGQSKSTGK